MAQHEQIIAKVNAPVDKGVAILVEVMNMHSGIITIESCEGNDQDKAFVFFTAFAGEESLLKHVQMLSKALSALEYCLEITWHYECDYAMARLLIPHCQIERAASCIKSYLVL